MTEVLREQIETLHDADQHQQIIDLILSLPEGERNYDLTSLLARAYVNLEDPKNWETALDLLLSVEEEGKTDAKWHFSTGAVLCRLLRGEEAEARFQAGYALVPPDSPELSERREICEGMLEWCRQMLDRQAAARRYGDSLDPQKAQDYLIYGVLLGNLPVPSRAEGNTIFLPQWQARIFPQVEQIQQQAAVVNLWMEAPQWGRTLYECSVGMGQTPSAALGMSGFVFLSTFVQGLARMEERIQPRELVTTFAGKEHRWELYPSDIAGSGSAPSPEPMVYWDALGEDIVKRLGNQKLCYVKIYGAKVNGEVTGECRIDDIKSGELSRKVAQMVEKWDVPQFGSHKQFFFIRQAEETTLSYPYLGQEGREKLRSAVVKAAKLFHHCRTDEDYDSCASRLAEGIGDATLAAECMAFLPEICAANAFPQLEQGETVELLREGFPKEVVYKNQLADYYPLGEEFIRALRAGEFGEDGDDIYQRYVGYSSTYDVVQQIHKKGSKLEHCRLSAFLFQMGADFEIR